MQVKELGHLVLYVRDLERSTAFYGAVLGWERAFPASPGFPAAAFTSGRTHHELLLIEVGEDAAPVARWPAAGALPLRPEDRRHRRRAPRGGGPPARPVSTVVGASDHTVTHSLYILDPDGNEIELYIDVPGVDWKSDPSLVAAPIRPLVL